MEEMPEQRRERTLPRVYIGILCCWLCVVLAPCITAVQPKDMHLNSRISCGHGDSKPPWHKVDKYSLYRIRDDVSPHTATTVTLTNCAMVFRSVSTDGRLCLYQRIVEFTNHNVELRLYDGNKDVDGKDMHDKIMNVDNDFKGVEWCTSGRFLTIELVIRAVHASVKDTIIDILLYHISSVHRKAYMDTSPSCSSVFKLDYSRVNVSNLDMRNLRKEVHYRCTLHFEYIGTEENRSLCMIFQPVGPRCNLNYSLTVYETLSMKGRDKNVPNHVGGCHKPMPKRWCSNGTKMALTLEREETIMREKDLNEYEKEVMFHALILDHHGGVETLPVLDPNPEDTPVEQFTTIIMVVAIVAVIIAVIVGIIVWKWRQTKRPRDSAKANGEACDRMLSQREQTRNGGNHYTAGTRPHPEDV